MECVEQLKTELCEAQKVKGSLAEKLRNLDFCIKILQKEVALRAIN